MLFISSAFICLAFRSSAYPELGDVTDSLTHSMEASLLEIFTFLKEEFYQRRTKNSNGKFIFLIYLVDILDTRRNCLSCINL